MLRLKRNKSNKKCKENQKMKLEHCKNQKSIHLKSKRSMKNLLKVWRLFLQNLLISYTKISITAVKKLQQKEAWKNQKKNRLQAKINKFKISQKLNQVKSAKEKEYQFLKISSQSSNHYVKVQKKQFQNHCGPIQIKNHYLHL